MLTIFAFIVIKVITMMMNWFTPTSSVKYIWLFLVVLEGLHVPVIPRAKPSGVPTPVGLPMAVRSRRRDQTEHD